MCSDEVRSNQLSDNDCLTMLQTRSSLPSIQRWSIWLRVRRIEALVYNNTITVCAFRVLQRSFATAFWHHFCLSALVIVPSNFSEEFQRFCIFSFPTKDPKPHNHFRCLSMRFLLKRCEQQLLEEGLIS